MGVKRVREEKNYFHLPRTLGGRLRPIDVINAWTRTKIAQGIRSKSKTVGLNNTSNNTRQMAVNMRRRFIHTAPRSNGSLVLYRGLSINNPNSIRNENGPSSWTNRRKTARVFALKNNPNGIVLRLYVNKNIPYIKVSPNSRLRYSHLGEHILPPGHIEVKGFNANERVWNVRFVPQKKYLTNWAFY
jgi:hypothetical protein